MTFPSRRKPIALLICYGFAGTLAGAYVADAHAQAATPLRVDPVLLGLPPIKPSEAPAPATPVSGAPVDKARAEVKPVEAAVVEARSVDVEVKTEPEASKPEVASQPAKASTQAIPARTVATPAPSPAPTATVSPVVAVPAPSPREEQTQAVPLEPARQTAKQPTPVPQPPAATTQSPVQAQVPPVAQPQPAPVYKSTAPANAAVSSLTPLRVDPALLGLPPVTATAASSPGVGGAPRPVAVASTPRIAGGSSSTDGVKTADADKSWFRRAWSTVTNPYHNGAWEFYLPFKTYHSPNTYTQEEIDSYQENPLGFGVGKGLYNERGNWEGVYFMGFQDSHNKPSYMAGYGWKAIWHPIGDVRVGLGYNAGLMTRSDMGYIPFPVILPVASIGFKNLSFDATYVPPFGDKGNVFFINAKWELGKKGEAIGTPARPVVPEPTQMANTSFGAATPVASQRVPYGPVFDSATIASLATSSSTAPPLVPATGPRDEIEVPDALPALALRSSKAMVPPERDSGVSPPVFLSAYRMGGSVGREFSAEGDAELRKIGTVAKADRLTYWPVEDEIEAEGNVQLEQGEDVITGPKMRLKLEDQVGFFEQPSFTIKRQPQAGSKAAVNKAYAEQFAEQQGDDAWFNSGFASPRALNLKPGQAKLNSTKMQKTMPEARGDADRIDFEGENQIRLTNGTYTTCAPGNNDWYVKAESLKLDYDREVAEGTDGSLTFLGIPIFYSPWLSFSLNNQRKSGFLSPTFGTTSNSGIEIALPYYWNIAPNMDATITPRTYSKRGVQANTEFRYLNDAFGGLYRGKAVVEYLPNDKKGNDEDRYGITLSHIQTTANGFSGLINYNRVSDSDYYTDLSSNISKTSQTQLLQQGMVTYGGGGWWNATANFQQYQTLQPDPDNPVLVPYKLLPQVTVNARQPDLGMTDVSFMGQFSSFSIDKRVQLVNGVPTLFPDGQRSVLYPQIALPYVTPGWYVTPKVGVNATYYNLSGQAIGTPSSISRTLPIVSVDAGMNFERSSNWFGRDYTQTLEPRLFYLNIPYKDQSKIPIFDTGSADFNFAQIFSENQFSGWDRINNANQLTAAMTSRLLEPSSGNEIMRAMLGQRFYFEKNKVTLPNAAPGYGRWDRSDFLAAFSGQILPKVYADAAWQYNLADRQVERYSMGARYQPEPGKVLNATYRYNRNPNTYYDQVDVSGQWPIGGGWHAVGRVNYSFKDSTTNPATGVTTVSQGGRIVESLAGLEYNGGCWVVRGVVQRLALTQEDSSTAFFIQLELNDFSRIGSNPLNLLKRNIQGYGLINAPADDSAFSR